MSRMARSFLDNLSTLVYAVCSFAVVMQLHRSREPTQTRVSLSWTNVYGFSHFSILLVLIYNIRKSDLPWIPAEPVRTIAKPFKLVPLKSMDTGVLKVNTKIYLAY